MKTFKRASWLATMAILAASFGRPAWAGSASIAVDTVWSRPAEQTAVVYATIHNRSGLSDRLVGATSPAAKHVGIHESATTSDPAPAMSMGGVSMPSGGSMMSMKPVDAIPVPANGTVRLQPGGYHLMLDLRRPIRAGETIPIRLHFARAGWIDAKSTVRPNR